MRQAHGSPAQGNRFASRVTITADLRPLIKREELVRSLRTTDPTEADCEHSSGKPTSLVCFSHLRRNARWMSRTETDTLVEA